jgi:hypothetical protein
MFDHRLTAARSFAASVRFLWCCQFHCRPFTRRIAKPFCAGALMVDREVRVAVAACFVKQYPFHFSSGMLCGRGSLVMALQASTMFTKARAQWDPVGDDAVE